MRRGIPAAALLAALFLPAGALAQPANASLICAPDDPRLDRFRHLRALSLDLTGDLPPSERMESLQSLDDVPEDWIDEMLGTEAFTARAVRRHRALLWNSLDNIRLLSNRSTLSTARVDSGIVYWRNVQGLVYRGARVPCLDEPVRYDPSGGIVTTEDEDGNRLEGWIYIRPYWDPATPIRVCAFDAATTDVSPSGVSCATQAGLLDPACGCGPGLLWCQTNASNLTTVRSMAEALDRRIGTLIAEDRPYTELFTTRRAVVNGPIVHFWRHQRGVPRGFNFEPPPVELGRLPDLRFDEVDRWVEIQLPAPHAGILTDPAYLMRFQTNRARGNRFFNSFLCRPFQPPAGGLPTPDDECSGEPDLQQRCGCKYCHAMLEPTAAHWGRWTEQGMGYLDRDGYPRLRTDCEDCARTGRQCSQECRRFYVTVALSPKEEPFLGMLRAYAFRRPDHERNVERGPRLLALKAVAENDLPLCTARNTVEWLLGRPATAEEEDWVRELSRRFVANGYSYRSLVKDVVMGQRYRVAR